MLKYLILMYALGNRNFANMTFANYWRMSWGCIGESHVDFHQLANVRGVYWRKSCGLSPIGECPEGVLANVHKTFANWRMSGMRL